MCYIRRMAIMIYVFGSRGRIGSSLVSLIQSHAGYKTEDQLEKADVAIDFSSPLGTQEILKQVVRLKKPIVIGTTGHSPENQATISLASQEIPILFSPNFSLGMGSCLEAAALLAKQLKNQASIDIIETHHLHKKDRPSGTALLLAQAMKSKEIPIHSLRAGDTLGDHTVIFTLEGERIELKHQVYSRNVFARGALKAAVFLCGQDPGLYSVKDLFS